MLAQSLASLTKRFMETVPAEGPEAETKEIASLCAQLQAYLQASGGMVEAVQCRDKECQQLGLENRLLRQKCGQLEEQNSQYGAQFHTLVQDMNQMRRFLDLLKPPRQGEGTETHDSPSVGDVEHARVDPAPPLGRTKGRHNLDTIREVTELSLCSEGDEEQATWPALPTCSEPRREAIQTQASFPEAQIDASQPMRGDCRQPSEAKVHLPASLIQESLSVIKHYPSSSSVCSGHEQMEIEAPTWLDNFPHMVPLQVQTQTELLFCGGYLYRGRLAVCQSGQPLPYGFGYLFQLQENSHAFLIYEGLWREGRFDGWGKMHFHASSQARLYHGKWRQGRAHGPGTLLLRSGAKFMGNFQAGVPQGEGSLYQYDGSIKAGLCKFNFRRP